METTVLNQALAGRYVIVSEIGRGGAATVYLADDPRHGRRVALKVMHPDVAAVVGSERFLREIGIAASLSHPHILPLHDSGRAGDLLFFVMPYVEGPTLRDRLEREGPLPLAEALRVASEVADALACAHRHGVIHRDVKPANILFHEGHAAVTDFGIAQRTGRRPSDPNTDPGMAVGTPEYMSPEACRGRTSLDQRADEYSLACVLYEMLAGTPPFTASSPQIVAMRHLAGNVPPLTTLRPDVPAEVAAVVHQALARDRDDRYPSLEVFADALRAASAGAEELAARSVAILPLRNAGGLPDDDTLCDGITDEIIALLSRVEGLRVAARTASFALREQGLDARAVAARLHVGAVLEGSVQRAGGRLRVSVQLVNARDGYLLWGERYDRDLADVFAIQDDIAGCVARALRVILRDEHRATRAHTTDVRAWEYYQRGRQYFRQTRRPSLECAREMFQRAIAADPSYALAWAGVADSCAQLHMYYPGNEADLLLADQASARALALAPDLADAHASRAFTLWQLGRPGEALTEFATAMELDPAQFEARYFCARLRFTRGELVEAAALFEDAARAREDYQARFFAAQSYAALGREAEAEAAYRRAFAVAQQHLELNPDDARAATMAAVSLCRLGRQREGLAMAEQAQRMDPGDPGVLYNVACLYALEGQADRALECIEQAMRGGFGHRDWIAHDPDLESLRHLPRFAAIMRH